MWKTSKLPLIFVGTGIGIGFAGPRLIWKYPERLYEARNGCGGCIPISISMGAWIALLAPPITLPLFIPFIPLMIPEAFGWEISKMVDEQLYTYSISHTKMYNNYEIEQKELMKTKHNKCTSTSTGNPQTTWFD